jgi:hypothetical protein
VGEISVSEKSGSLKALLAAGGLTAPASTMLTNLVLEPTVSLDISFWVILGIGFVFFTLSLGSLFAEKHDFKQAAWHIASMSFAGFVFVSWARYQSLLVSGIAALVILATIVFGTIFSKKKIASFYSKNKILVYGGLILAVILPLAPVVQNIGRPPELVITASPKFIYMTDGSEKTINVTIFAAYANVWDIAVTSEPSTTSIAAYLDDKEGGPIEIPFLERSHNITCKFKIEVSPELEVGPYNLTLNSIYTDGIGNSYQKSNLLEINIYDNSTSPSPLTDNYVIASPLLITSIASLGELIVYFAIIRRK